MQAVVTVRSQSAKLSRSARADRMRRASGAQSTVYVMTSKTCSVLENACSRCFTSVCMHFSAGQDAWVYT